MTDQSDAFTWPEGKRAAVSLTFDDARLSQADIGLGLLDACGVKATFYVTPTNLPPRLPVWERAVAAGHEIGNHTQTHPCSANFAWSRHNALEDYTLERLEADLVAANAAIVRALGVIPRTFAYPCGQKFVGRGAQVSSYVPLIARHFLVGRGFREEAVNVPGWCDMAQAAAFDADGQTWEQYRTWIELAVAEGGWLILAGHEIREEGVQTVRMGALASLCDYCQDPANGIWINTVAAIGDYLSQRQGARA